MAKLAAYVRVLNLKLTVDRTKRVSGKKTPDRVRFRVWGDFFRRDFFLEPDERKFFLEQVSRNNS